MKKIVIGILFVVLLAFVGFFVLQKPQTPPAPPSESQTSQLEFGQTLDEIPPFTGEPYIEINGNKADFDAEDITDVSFEKYGDLDQNGRCTGAFACLSLDTMPAEGESREDISSVHPSGWVSGQGWERCHLIGWQLGAENANARNLITGTHFLNVSGMLPFELQVSDHIKKTGGHVMYAVIPVYASDADLIASGVIMQGYSVEDHGTSVNFNVYCFNAAPDLEIDYKTGIALSGEDKAHQDEVRKFVLNTSSMKFHYPSCDSVADIATHNRQDVSDSRANLMRQGYMPCGRCEP